MSDKNQIKISFLFVRLTFDQDSIKKRFKENKMGLNQVLNYLSLSNFLGDLVRTAEIKIFRIIKYIEDNNFAFMDAVLDKNIIGNMSSLYNTGKCCFLQNDLFYLKEDELLGKIVEVKHDKYVALYQSLSEVSVKKGDTIFQGQPIGKSGTNELDKSIGNHLHFELSYDGNIVNPLDHLNKELKD